MNQPTPAQPQVVGVIPWLPWPLSAWSWWTTPVRAERLALLRIGVALVLLADILLQYAPDTLAYFGTGGLADETVFGWRFHSPRLTWSLLRGVGDGATQYLSLILWIAMTLWIAGNSCAQLLLVHKDAPAADRSGIALWIWSAAFAWYVAGVWSRMVYADPVQLDALAWVVPLAGVSLTCLFQALDLGARLRGSSQRIPWMALFFSFILANAMLCAGLILSQVKEIDKDALWVRMLGSWQDWQQNEAMRLSEDKRILFAVMIAWIASAGFLLVGCGTRFAAVVAWLLSMSFANVNPRLDNAGDTIRLILLFYLMLCPCGAVWSIDALWKRRTGPVYVHPWPICLLFVQMIFMYWINGLYKLFGESWQQGTSLYYVFGDLALARFSQIALPVPFVVTQIMSYSVLTWETFFPFMVLFKWPRRIALFFGVMFHIGIMVSLELGAFVPYALCFYLPLIPWEWLDRSKAPAPAVDDGQT